MKKALIAMSGGVDSSVAACLMQQKGYDIIGVTMKLYDNEDIHETQEKTCCSLSDVEDARNVAHILGFPYYVFNFKADFKTQVIDRFIDAYENCETPNPCIDCNRYLKFRELYHRALELGCDYVVTGHYADIEEKDGRFLLKKAADPRKDQSYVLYSLTQEQLAHTLFPLGTLEKAETRQIAEENGLLNAHKHDSQDICFVPDGDYAAFIEKTTHRKYPEGDFVDTAGHVLGRHKGIIHYTVGQRKGLGLAMGHPVFVTEIRPDTNEVVIGENADVFASKLYANKLNFMAAEAFTGDVRAKAKIRYSHAGADCTVRMINEDTLECVFDEPQRAVTPGQALVLYDGEYVLGGGTIIGKAVE